MCPLVGERSCPIASIANADTRTAANSAINRRPKSRLRKILSARVRYTCRARTRSLAVRNAELYCPPRLSRQRNAPSAALSCILAASARILTPRAASNAANLFLSASRAKTSAISARFIPCVCEWKRKPRRQAPPSLWMLGRLSKIYSKNNEGNCAIRRVSSPNSGGLLRYCNVRLLPAVTQSQSGCRGSRGSSRRRPRCLPPSTRRRKFELLCSGSTTGKSR